MPLPEENGVAGASRVIPPVNPGGGVTSVSVLFGPIMVPELLEGMARKPCMLVGVAVELGMVGQVLPATLVVLKPGDKP